MNIIEALKNDIELSKDWHSSDRIVLNQITIMEALVVLLERATEKPQEKPMSQVWNDYKEEARLNRIKEFGHDPLEPNKEQP